MLRLILNRDEGTLTVKSDRMVFLSPDGVHTIVCIDAQEEWKFAYAKALYEEEEN